MPQSPFLCLVLEGWGRDTHNCVLRLHHLEVLLPSVSQSLGAARPHTPCPLPTQVCPRVLPSAALLFCLPRFLLILFTEIDYWERLLFEIPHYVVNLAERAEDLRVLRENLLLVARDYNR